MNKITSMKSSVITIFVIITLLGMPVGGLVSSTAAMPIENVIVVMDQNDPIINEAIETLKIELDQYTIVNYGSFKYSWTASLKFIQNVIFVGHGDKDTGVSLNQKTVSWENFASVVSGIQSGKVHFLNCDSGKIKEFLPESKIGVSFDGDIDAITGALYLSLMLVKEHDQKTSIFGKLLDRAKKLFSGEITPNVLGKFSGSDWTFLSPTADDNEKSGQSVFFFLTILSTFGLLISKEKIEAAEGLSKFFLTAWRYTGGLVTMASWFTKIVGLVYSYQNYLDIATKIVNIIKDAITSVLSAIINFIDSIYSNDFLNALIDALGWLIVYDIAALLVFIIGLTASAGGTGLAAILNAVLGWALFFFYLAMDILDCDTKFSASPGKITTGSCSTSNGSPSGPWQ